MNSPVAKVAIKRAILSTINSLYALAMESADVISIRIEYSSKMKLMNIVIFSDTTTHHAHNLVLLDNEKALDDLLAVEDLIIERVAQLRDELEVVA
jgi:energy-converting hydrogenase Eha subunit G